MVELTLSINGSVYRVKVPENKTLLDTLREDLGLTGTKKGCDQGECGACTVLLDGLPVSSCLVLAADCEGKEITTVEGLARNGTLDALQESFIRHGAIQCGFCTPGMLLTAKFLLREIPQPTEEEIRTYLAGNICRCTGYVKIIEAIKAASAGELATASARREAI